MMRKGAITTLVNKHFPDMPYKPLPRCRICGDKHKGRCKMDAKREFDPFYWSALWLRTRKHQLKIEPLCRHCEQKGDLVPAREVDHITPISRGGHRTDSDNLQSLCKSCHSRKTITEMRNPE